MPGTDRGRKEQGAYRAFRRPGGLPPHFAARATVGRRA
jgi:hypothetical protein